MAEPQTPPLYDVDKAMRELARARRKRDELTRVQASIGDSLATNIDRHFSADEIETVGRALVIAAGSLASLVEEPGMLPLVLVNVLGFAGDRLARDGQTISQTPISESPDA